MKTIKLMLATTIFSLLIPCAVLAQATFSGERITKAIQGYVQDNSNFETEVEIQQSIKKHSFSKSGIRANFSHNNELRGLCRINIEFYDGKEIVGRDEIRINVKLFAEVPVASRFIAKGNEIKSDDLTMAKAEITQIDTEQLLEIKELIGKKSKSGIAKGNVVRTVNIRDNSGIRIQKSNKVNLLHYMGAICIKSTGFALDDGEVGDIIRVKKDNKTLCGFVAEDGNIIIEDKQILETKK